MKSKLKIFSCCFFLGMSLMSFAQDQEQPFSIELTGTMTHFEQQVKTEIGGVKGDLLAADTELGLQLLGTYKFWEYLHAGWYIQYNIGNREDGRFNGFDANGSPLIVSVQGGSFSEFWIGPIIRGQYKKAFLELGYGFVGSREDEARDDISNGTLSNQGNFSTDPSVAWIIGIGTQVDLSNNFSLLIKAQYRARYYNSRNGIALNNQTVLGTQDFSPLIGVSYKL